VSDYPKRLIEVDLPIKKISAHARREKSIRQGHISTLHIWWARRPLAACRAVLCAALWPDPADPLCPQKFRDDACRLINEFATKAASDKGLAQRCSHDAWTKWQALAKGGGLDGSKEPHWNVLRFALLDFIADFANWDNSVVSEYLETARGLTQSAHEALGGEPGTRPLVADPFAGGGSIPLEALRVGADAFASDLNPLAVLLNKVVLEYIPKYGQRLADEVRQRGEQIEQEAEKALRAFYPLDTDGATPIAYLWARTITCEGPGCGFTLPLIRSAWLNNHEALSLEADTDNKRFKVEVVAGGGAAGVATIKGGSVTCPKCKYTTLSKAVRSQLTAKRGGSDGAQLLAVQVERQGARRFRSPNEQDYYAYRDAAQHPPANLPDAEINPIRPYKNTRGVSAVTRIGLSRFVDLFNSRQRVAISVFLRSIKEAARICGSEPLPSAAVAVLGLAFGRLLHQNCSCSRWLSKRSTVTGAFGKQALQVTWDFAETTPLSGGPGSWASSIDWVLRIIEANSGLPGEGTAVQSVAKHCPLPDDAVSMVFTDPPYFAAIPYSDLANFFYVWEREVFEGLFQGMFSHAMVDQTEETIVTNANMGRDGVPKDDAFFRSEMTLSLARARQLLSPDGIGTVVFADTATTSWEALLGAVVDSGWIITASWPIDTERQVRTQAQGAASLQSSVHLVCRPREHPDGSQSDESVGDWRDVLQELPQRIHQWMPRLAGEGVVGADAIFACLGPALEIFSRYTRVEKPNGEEVTLKEYLEYVWAAVSREAISMIFEGADTTGFEEDARLTAMWLWTLNPGPSNEETAAAGETEDVDDDSDEKPAKAAKTSGFTLEYDAARKIAQGLGAHLEHMVNLVEVKGETARLLPVAERTQALFGKEGAESPAAKRKKSPQLSIPGLFEELEGDEGGWTLESAAKPGETTLDRLHQAMILFAAGRGDALRRFLVDEGAGKDQRFWRLAQSLCALYPSGTDERRWSEGVLARKKGLGL
jgi:adenine-specific DNA methylase